jgi:DNA-directed RNA polymerase specialized sigma24 family protein
MATIAAAEAETEPLWKTTSSEDLQAAIVRLPEGLRTPLLLAIFERVSHRAIAERMSISTLAVTMRLFRAKRTLKRILEEQRAQRAVQGGAAAPDQGQPAARSARGARGDQ